MKSLLLIVIACIVMSCNADNKREFVDTVQKQITATNGVAFGTYVCSDGMQQYNITFQENDLTLGNFAPMQYKVVRSEPTVLINMFINGTWQLAPFEYVVDNNGHLTATRDQYGSAVCYTLN